MVAARGADGQLIGENRGKNRAAVDWTPAERGPEFGRRGV